MSGTRFAASLAAGCFLAWGGLVPVWAQPALERLEESIRSRAAGATAAAAPKAEGESGYLGAVADDKNDRGRGVRILDVRPDGPAAKAGLKPNDLVTAVAELRVRQMTDMADILGTFPPGETITFDVLRDGKAQKIKVTLGRRPAAKATDMPEAVPPPPTAIPPGTVPEEPPAGPQLTPPKPAAPPAEKPRDLAAAGGRTIEDILRRIDQLERRVEALERALEEAHNRVEPARP